VTVETSVLRDNIEHVQQTIAEAAVRARRDPAAVKLVAVTKTVSPERVAQAAALGLRCFGENRVQEAAAKIPRVSELVDFALEWHLVGTLQRNKVKRALSLFDILHSVDSLRLAEEIERQADGSPVPVLLEVYLGDDPARPGFRAGQLDDQLAALLAWPRLQMRGLMTVAPLGLDEQGNRAIFAGLRELRDRLVAAHSGLDLPELSMGMTDDYPSAISEGATIVRIGRAIFGERPSQ
jgi:pyridoxal phosphate enzyme (YggS family)